jgi:hypothetical protein
MRRLPEDRRDQPRPWKREPVARLKKFFRIGGKNLTKAETLAEAGISTSAAQRYEELTGPREATA